MIKRPVAFLALALTGIGIFTMLNFQAGMNQFRPPYTITESKTDYTKIELTNNISPYSHERDTLLILLSVGDANSYGKDRSVKDFMSTLNQFKFETNQLTLGLLVGDEKEYTEVLEYFKEYFSALTYKTLHDFVHKVTLINAPFIEESFNKINRESRHDDNVQRLRRRTIARSRNFVLNNALEGEKYTLFIDSDIVKIHHPDMIKRFINSRKDIIVPRIIRGDNPDYDKNSWKGQRTKPNDDQFKKMDIGDWEHWDYVPRDVPDNMVHFDSFLKQNENKSPSELTSKIDYSFELDSVGGAILFSKSIIYKQGIQFPPNYVIGTTWERLEGYDGIETEGLCYIAKSCGYKCYGYPNLVAEHSLH